MKLNKAIALAAALMTMLVLSPLFLPAHSQDDTETASPGAQEDQTIRDNVRRRIEQVVQSGQDTESPTLNSAIIGTLDSRTQNTLSIMTREGLQLASTSAQTNFVDADSQTLDLEDLSIGDFIASLGVLEADTDVLVTYRVIVQNEAPETQLNQPFYGILTTIDEDSDMLTIINPDTNTSQSFQIDADTTYFSLNQQGETNELDDVTELSTDHLAVVFFPGDDQNDTLPEIIKIVLVETPTEDLPQIASPAATPEEN